METSLKFFNFKAMVKYVIDNLMVQFMYIVAVFIICSYIVKSGEFIRESIRLVLFHAILSFNLFLCMYFVLWSILLHTSNS